MVNSVTAEQISKSPDGDAAQAVKRVSGVTAQDGKYVFVRGLGERYAGCLVTVVDEKGATVTKRYYGSIVEYGGQFKFLSYTNDF